MAEIKDAPWIGSHWEEERDRQLSDFEQSERERELATDALIEAERERLDEVL